VVAGNTAHTHGSFNGFRKIGSKEKRLRVNNAHEWRDYYTPTASVDPHDCLLCLEEGNSQEIVCQAGYLFKRAVRTRRHEQTFVRGATVPAEGYVPGSFMSSM
jgi:hypothetical protein